MSSWEWCFVCGAIRKLQSKRLLEDEYATMIPRSKWVVPTGDRNDNPYDKLKDV